MLPVSAESARFGPCGSQPRLRRRTPTGGPPLARTGTHHCSTQRPLRKLGHARTHRPRSCHAKPTGVSLHPPLSRCCGPPRPPTPSRGRGAHSGLSAAAIVSSSHPTSPFPPRTEARCAPQLLCSLFVFFFLFRRRDCDQPHARGPVRAAGRTAEQRRHAPDRLNGSGQAAVAAQLGAEFGVWAAAAGRGGGRWVRGEWGSYTYAASAGYRGGGRGGGTSAELPAAEHATVCGCFRRLRWCAPGWAVVNARQRS